MADRTMVDRMKSVVLDIGASLSQGCSSLFRRVITTFAPASPAVSRKRPAPDSDESSASRSEQQPEPHSPALHTDPLETFAATMAARQNVLPSRFRGEPLSKRPRRSPTWTSPAWTSPALHHGVITPHHFSSPAVHTRTTQWRQSLPPRAPCFSAASTLHFGPSPSPVRTSRPAPVVGPMFGPRQPALATPRPHRPLARRDSVLARLTQGSHTASYMRRYRYRIDSARPQRPVPDALRIDGGRVKKPDRARTARIAAAKASLVATNEDNARALRESAWPPPFPKVPIPDARPIRANSSRTANGINGYAFANAKRTRPPPMKTRAESALNTSALTPVPAVGQGRTASRPAATRAAQVVPLVTASRPPQSGTRPQNARHAVSEQQQSDVDSNVPLHVAAETVDVAKRAGLSRDQLCEIYTPGLVEVMEKNPLFAEKLLKKHGAEMSAELLYPARMHERKWRIVAAQEDLVKIRSQSHLYTAVQHHSEAVRTSALKATADVLASALQAASLKDGGAAEKPPADNASLWNAPYFVPNDGHWEEDAKSLAEKEQGRTVVNEKSAFSPLTESAMKRLRKMMSDPRVSHTRLADIAGCRITGNDLRLLKPNTWLNDEIVNSYMELLFRRSEKFGSEKGGPKYAKIKVISSFFYSKLFAENKATGQFEYDYTRVRRWTRRFDVFDYDMFIVPINQHNMHWTLGVVNFKDKRVEHYDSFGGGGSAEILSNLQRWVCDEMENKKGQELDVSEWSQVAMTARLPQQNNSDDCGVFVCKFADFISRNAEITFKGHHMLYYRARIAHEILMERVS